MKNESIQALKVQALFENKQTYIIPMYQRNYAWGEKEIDQLILDIQDYQNQPDQINQVQTQGNKNIILAHWLFLRVAMANMKLSMVSNDLPR